MKKNVFLLNQQETLFVLAMTPNGQFYANMYLHIQSLKSHDFGNVFRNFIVQKSMSILEAFVIKHHIVINLGYDVYVPYFWHNTSHEGVLS